MATGVLTVAMLGHVAYYLGMICLGLVFTTRRLRALFLDDDSCKFAVGGVGRSRRTLGRQRWSGLDWRSRSCLQLSNDEARCCGAFHGLSPVRRGPEAVRD